MLNWGQELEQFLQYQKAYETNILMATKLVDYLIVARETDVIERSWKAQKVNLVWPAYAKD